MTCIPYTATVAKLLLTKREAAKALGVSERTVDYWRRDGKLPAVTIGSHPRFDTRDIQNLIDRHKEAPATGVKGGPPGPSTSNIVRGSWPQ